MSKLQISHAVMTNEMTPTDFVQTSGTNFLDSGFIIEKNDVAVYIDFEKLNAGNGYFFSQKENNLPNWFTVEYNSNNDGLYANIGNTTICRISPDNPVNWRIQMLLSAKNGKWTCSGTYSASGTYTWTVITPGTTLWFSVANTTSPDYMTAAKWYGIKIQQEDVLVRDFVPIISKALEKMFYDKVHRIEYRLRELGGAV